MESSFAYALKLYTLKYFVTINGIYLIFSQTSTMIKPSYPPFLAVMGYTQDLQYSYVILLNC